MSRITLIMLLIIVVTFSLTTPSHAWFIYHKPAFKGKVIDSETKLPIKEAVVMVVYRKTLVAGFEPITSVFDIREALTDDEGLFNIPSYTTVINPLSVSADVKIIIYKPGYGQYFPKNLSAGTGLSSDLRERFFSEDFGEEKKIKHLTGSVREGTGPHQIWSNVIFGIAELPKLKTIEERKHVNTSPVGDSEFWDKQKLFIKAIRDEWQYLYGKDPGNLYLIKEKQK